jgi:hypothetical protein
MVGVYLAVLVVTAACMLHAVIAGRGNSMILGGAVFVVLWTAAMAIVYLVWTAFAGHTPSTW